MNSILQDILGLFKKRKIVKTLETTDYIPLATFKKKKDPLKPNPEREIAIISATDLKAYILIDAGSFTGGTIVGAYIQTATLTTVSQTTLPLSKTITNGSVRSFITRIIGVKTSTGDAWIHEFRGAVKQISSVTSLIGTVTDESIAEDAATSAWTAVIEAGTGVLDIKVTSLDASEIKWRAETIFSEILV
jgi:hypothetical protein